MSKNLLKTYFLENVTQCPGHIAIEAGDQKYSYQEFNKLIDDIAGEIEELGIRNKIIIVLNDHSVFTYASILAINFTGNSFLPIDPLWPSIRIESSLEAVKPAAIFAVGSEQINLLIDRVPRAKKFLIVDSSTKKRHHQTTSVGEARIFKEVAYVLFTSGSTGIPKGVPVSHKNLNAFLEHNKSFYDFNYHDRFLQVYELTFDVAYFSFFMPLCVGACCRILSNKNSLPKYLSIINDLLTYEITVVSMVPTIINLSKKFIRNKTVLSVRHCFFIGDVLYHSEAAIWQNFVPQAQLHNYYGPTEVTIACSDYFWNKSSEPPGNDIVPIGKLFSGLKYKIIDEEMQEVLSHTAGELLLCGLQVVEGYVNNVHQEKFINSSLEKEDVYYRTGDLVALDKNENLVFYGRVDHQVKLNGHRIELNEVQIAVNKLVGRKAIVIKKKRKDGLHYLSAVVEGNKLAVQDLKEGLRKVLPEYMIPSEFVFIQQFPLNENGKIDISLLQNS